MKLSRRGMIKIKMPAINATIAGMCAEVMTIEFPVMRGESFGGMHFSVAGPKGGDAKRPRRFHPSQKLPENAAVEIGCSRNDAAPDALGCGRTSPPAP